MTRAQKPPIQPPASVPDHPQVMVMPQMVYVGAFAAGLLTQGAVGGALPIPLWLRVAVGLPLLVLGTVGSVLFARRLDDAGQEREAFAPTTALVSDGIYARSRNPGYVSLTLAYAGFALLLGNPWLLAALAPLLVVMHYGVVLREERYLELKFGEEYVDYRSRVRRYL